MNDVPQIPDSSSSKSGMSIAARYERAADRTGPRLATRTPSSVVDGYWVSPSLYFFVDEVLDEHLGRTVPIARLADLLAGDIADVLSLETLAAVLSEHLRYRVEKADLLSVQFDMPDVKTVALTYKDQWYLFDRTLGGVTETGVQNTTDVLYSPDGRLVCKLEGYDAAIIDRVSGDRLITTADGVEHNAYGRDSESALGGYLARKSPSTVGLWSPDSRWFLTHQIDERAVPSTTLVQSVPPEGSKPLTYKIKYPTPGDPVPLATIVALDCVTGAMVRFEAAQLPIMAFSPFAARRVWFGETGTAWLLRVDRYNRRVELLELDLVRGVSRVVMEEIVLAGYLDLNPVITGTPNIRVIPETGEIIWFSEADGWGHISLGDPLSGRIKNKITHGPWLVRDVVHVESRTRKIYFLANGLHGGASRTRRSLCVIDFAGSNFLKLAHHNGDVHVSVSEPAGLGHRRPYRPAYTSAGFSADARYACVRRTNIALGETVSIDDFQTGRVLQLGSHGPECGKNYPRPFSVLAADGCTPLSGVMFAPSDFCADSKYPLIDYIYPGPQAAHAPQQFNSIRSTYAAAIAELGVITIMLDTRGNPPGSRDFHQVGYGSLIEPQLADHAAAILQLAEQYSFIEVEKVGIVGQSAGGAATVRALCDYGHVFKVGVAACGNHDSGRYAAIWSDKYRGPRPQAGWVDQTDLAVVSAFAGRLLLISGDMDENVHLSQTLGLVDQLIAANKDFDLLIVPNAGHDVLMTSGYVQRRVWDYLVTHLIGQQTPHNFQLSFSPEEIRSYLNRALREVLQ